MKNTKENLSWLWQNAERVLVIIFFLTFAFNIRKVFLTPYSFLNGGFNEYMTMSFSWTDLLMLTTIFMYTTKYILRQVINPYYGSFNLEKTSGKSSINVSRETFYLLIFLGWTGLSIFWSQYPPIAIYRFFTLIEITLFSFVAVKSLSDAKWLKLAFFAIILSGLFQSFLGIAQFIHNRSLEIRFLGESIIGPNIDGVAKILIDGEKHVRAYGTFPHPNILAGFLLIPLFVIISELIQRKFLLTSSQPSPYQGEGGDNSPPLYKERARMRCENVPHETFLGFIPRRGLFAILLITGSGFLLTFSRSAFLGFFFGFSIFLIWSSYLQSLERLKSNFKFFISIIIALIFITILLLVNTSFFSNQSLRERILFQNVSYETILKHPFAGIGIGQFVMNEYQKHPSIESWQYQPVHNLYLLLFSELGIVGLIFFLLWIFSILKWGIGKNGNTGVLLTYYLFYCIVFSFLFISFFDHYFWDIESGTLIFILPFVLILALAANSKNARQKFSGCYNQKVINLTVPNRQLK